MTPIKNAFLFKICSYDNELAADCKALNQQEFFIKIFARKQDFFPKLRKFFRAMKYSIKKVLSDAAQRLSEQKIDTPRLD
ncbi:MAG: hypothetical protein IJG32_07090, partial [Selenomonadaceae bacterium]|nr:hypothetical protein [Selenomonadaceae bacterium]